MKNILEPITVHLRHESEPHRNKAGREVWGAKVPNKAWGGEREAGHNRPPSNYKQASQCLWCSVKAGPWRGSWAALPHYTLLLATVCQSEEGPPWKQVVPGGQGPREFTFWLSQGRHGPRMKACCILLLKLRSERCPVTESLKSSYSKNILKANVSEIWRPWHIKKVRSDVSYSLHAE